MVQSTICITPSGPVDADLRVRFKVSARATGEAAQQIPDVRMDKHAARTKKSNLSACSRWAFALHLPKADDKGCPRRVSPADALTVFSLTNP
ncbi:hypothetical protein PTKU46_36060 [Paraburkholderia terrae]